LHGRTVPERDEDTNQNNLAPPTTRAPSSETTRSYLQVAIFNSPFCKNLSACSVIDGEAVIIE
jgi:hypothetical protein